MIQVAQRIEIFIEEYVALCLGRYVDEIERMIGERAGARTKKDWKRADAIRDHLQEMGIVLEDGPQGTTWRFDV